MSSKLWHATIILCLGGMIFFLHDAVIWNASERANMLIRSSLFRFTRYQVFLFDMQRSTSGYCMRECKHTYCSGLNYSPSSRDNLSFNSMWAFQHSRTCLSIAFSRVRARVAPRVLDFSASVQHRCYCLNTTVCLNSVDLQINLWSIQPCTYSMVLLEGHFYVLIASYPGS